MKNIYTLKFLLVLFLCSMTSMNTSIIAQQSTAKFGLLSFNKAVNISGKQRMLTQKMVKSYLYLIENANDSKAKRDLMTSKIIFEKQNAILLKNSKAALTKNRIAKVKTLWVEFKKLLETKPNYDDARKLIDSNTDILKAANNVVLAVISESKGASGSGTDLLEDDGAQESDLELKKIINMAGRQRMLSQRLALYYFASQKTLKDENSTVMLKNVFNELDGAITMLLISEFNNSKVEEKIGLAMSIWEPMRDNKEKFLSQGYKPSEVYKMSNDLTKAFNAVTMAYEKTKL